LADYTHLSDIKQILNKPDKSTGLKNHIFKTNYILRIKIRACTSIIVLVHLCLTCWSRSKRNERPHAGQITGKWLQTWR